MSSLIHSMIMGTPTNRRLSVAAPVLSTVSMGVGFALSSSHSSFGQFSGLMLVGAACAWFWRSHMSSRQEIARLSDKQSNWQSLVNGTQDSVVVLSPRQDLMGRFMGWEIREANAQAHRLFGVPQGSLPGQTLLDLLPVGLHASFHLRLHEVRTTREPQIDEHKLYRPESGDEPRWLRHQIIPLADGVALVSCDSTGLQTALKASTQGIDAELDYALSIARDATAQRLAADRIHLASRVIEETGDAVVVSDAVDRVVMVNPAFLNMTGLSPSEVIGKSAELLGLAPLREPHLQGVAEALRAKQRWSGESHQICQDGGTLDTWMSVSTLCNDAQRVTQHVRVFSDISVLKAQQRDLAAQARHDSLTGLPNRRAFGERLDQAMARARRSRQTLAVLYVDLDDFKAVNDGHGHGAGDTLLIEVGQRLLSCVRLTDCVCRLAGDEFTVILEGAGHTDEVRRIGLRILERLKAPHDIARQDVVVSPSIGAAVYEFGESVEQLCQRADAAMYGAKRGGKAAFLLAQEALAAHEASAPVLAMAPSEDVRVLACQGAN